MRKFHLLLSIVTTIPAPFSSLLGRTISSSIWSAHRTSAISHCVSIMDPSTSHLHVRNPSKQTAMSIKWKSIPPAIRALILAYIAQEAASDHTLAQYAAVSRDWQYFFEQLTFRCLRLGPHDRPEFDRLILLGNRRKWIRKVSFLAHGGPTDVFPRLEGQQPTDSTRMIPSMSRLCQLEELYLQDSDIFQYLDGQNQKTKDQSIATLIPWFPASLKRLHVLGAGGDDNTRTCQTLVKHLALFANNNVALLEGFSITTTGNAAVQFPSLSRYYRHEIKQSRTSTSQAYGLLLLPARS